MATAPLVSVMSNPEAGLVGSNGVEVTAALVVRGNNVIVVGQCPPREKVVRCRRS